jgi:hypothetical protein
LRIRPWGSSSQEHDLCVTCCRRWELSSDRAVRGNDHERYDDSKRPEELKLITHTVAPRLSILPAHDEPLLSQDARNQASSNALTMFWIAQRAAP